MASISFEPLTHFDERAEQDFASVGPVHFYKSEHEQRLCALFAVMKGEKRVGSVLFCSETKQETGERVLAVMAASGKSSNSLIEDGAELINAYAKSTGHQTVKFYTDRPELAYKFLKMGARAKVSWSV